MLNISRILIDGAILCLISSVFLLLLVRANPRYMLQDYPKEIQAIVPPKTPDEKRLSTLLGLPFLAALLAIPLISTLAFNARAGGAVPFPFLFLHAFSVAFIFNVFDWLVLDWLLFCAITPRFMVIPGSEGHPAYKNYFFHFRGFLIGTVFSALAGLIFAAIVWVF